MGAVVEAARKKDSRCLGQRKYEQQHEKAAPSASTVFPGAKRGAVLCRGGRKLWRTPFDRPQFCAGGAIVVGARTQVIGTHADSLGCKQGSMSQAPFPHTPHSFTLTVLPCQPRDGWCGFRRLRLQTLATTAHQVLCMDAQEGELTCTPVFAALSALCL